MEKLRFEPADLALNANLCVAFREDSFVISFGDASRFFEADGRGAERYVEWLRSRISKNPDSVVHVWDGLAAFENIQRPENCRDLHAGFDIYAIGVVKKNGPPDVWWASEAGIKHLP